MRRVDPDVQLEMAADMSVIERVIVTLASFATKREAERLALFFREWADTGYWHTRQGR